MKSDEDVYIKIDGKYKAYGKVWDREVIPYGIWFVDNQRGCKKIRRVEAMPEFTNLEAAMYASQDVLCQKISEYFNALNGKSISMWDISDMAIKSIRDTLLQKQRQSLHILKTL